jgi:tRNA(Ile)-lysidine synthase TilS/MesJ
MAVYNFLSNNHDVTPLFINHGTETSKQAESFLRDLMGSKLVLRHISRVDTPKNTSQEEHWRNERYKIFHSFDTPIVTCHHLDDCVENWIFTSLHGEGRIIPYRNRNVIRPFRLTKKADFVEWCNRKGVSWIEDKTNLDIRFMRNYIRHELVPKAFVVNPGLYKVVSRKVNEDENTDCFGSTNRSDCNTSVC